MLDPSYFFRSGRYPYFREQPNPRLRPEERIAAGARLQAAPPPPFGVPRRDAAAQRGGSRLGRHPKVSYPCVEKGYQEGADAAIEYLQAGFFTYDE